MDYGFNIDENSVFQLLFQQGQMDCTCGFKFFEPKTIKNLRRCDRATQTGRVPKLE